MISVQTARNIRHLPCVVRRNGLRGVCMFAIDCMKANGTHLGTCVDQFYFGSCCRMKNYDEVYSPDLTDNRIDDNDYERPLVTLTTLAVPSSSSPSTMAHPSPSTSYSSWRTTTSRPPTTHIRNVTYELVSSSSNIPVSSTTEKYSVSIGSFSTTLGTITHKNTTSSIGLRDESDQKVTTEENVKLSTFQSVQESVNKTGFSPTESSQTALYSNFTTLTTTPRTTILSTTNRTVTRKTTTKSKPTTSKVTRRPIQDANKVTNSTQKPSSSIPPRRPTKPVKVSSIKTTQKPATTSKPVNRKPVSNTIVNRNSTKVTRRPTNPTKKVPVTVTSTSSTLTTMSYVETTKAPRPKPTPTGKLNRIFSLQKKF